MSNALTKDKLTTYYPGHPAIPAYAGQPYLPERDVWATMTVGGWEATTTISPNVASVSYVLVPANSQTGQAAYYQKVYLDKYGNVVSGAESTSYTYVTKEQSYLIRLPEQPYIAPVAAVDAEAARTVIDLNLGWNAGGRSIEFFEGDGYMSITAPANVIGAVVGLNDNDLDAGYANIEFAWYFSHGVARVYESGSQVFYSGAYAGGDVFRIERIGGAITYKKNGSTVFTSSKTSRGAVFMDASLYAGDDMLYDPAISGMSSGFASLLPLAGAGGNVAFAQSMASLLPLTALGGFLPNSNARLEPLVAMGSDRPYGASSVSFKPLRTFGQGGMMTPEYAIGDAVILYLTVAATGLTGEIGGSSASLRPLDVLASGDDVLSTVVSSTAGDFFANFSLNNTTENVIVGIAPTATVGAYTEITHGVLAESGYASVIENGAIVYGIGSFGPADVFTIQRNGDQVSYLLNGAVVYTSTQPSTGTVYLVETVMATAPTNPGDVTGDSLVGTTATFSISSTADNIIVGLADSPTVQYPSWIGYGIWVDNGSASIVEYGYIKQVVGPYQSSDVWTIERVGTTVTYYLNGQEIYVSTEPSYGDVYLVEYAFASAPTQPGDVTNDTLNQYSLKSYGEAVVSLAPLAGYGSAYEGNTNASMLSVTEITPTIVGAADIVLVMNSDLTVAAVLAIQSVVGATVHSDAAAVADMVLQAVVNAQMQTTVFAGFGIPVFDTEQNACSVWVVNAETEATTRYENFDFNSYGMIDGRYFGCKTDGLYLLEGDKDGTDFIRASIDFGNDNFGSSLRKACPHAYLGVASSGTMYLKVTVEGEEYIYAARSDDPEMQVQRVDLGKGIRANYLRFEIYNSDGCDFELDTVEFSVVALSRRI